MFTLPSARSQSTPAAAPACPFHGQAAPHEPLQVLALALAAAGRKDAAHLPGYKPGGCEGGGGDD